MSHYTNIQWTKLPQFIKSIRISPKTEEDSSENPRLAGILLPNKVHLVSLAVVDFQFGEGCGRFLDELAAAETTSVRKQFLLEVFRDPLFDYDIVSIALFTLAHDSSRFGQAQ